MAIVRSARDVETKVMDGEARGVTMRVLLSPEDGARNFIMRLFSVEPGGRTPLHSHPWEHEVFVLAGNGIVVSESGENSIEPGSAVYISPGEKHCFRNTGREELRFICVVPTEKHYTRE